jgi:hypothetical protein
MMYTWFSDSLSGPNGPLDPTNWSAQGVNGCRILDNECTSNGIGFSTYIGAVAATIPADQWASFEVSSLDYDSGSGNGATLNTYVRGNNAETLGYFLLVERNSDGTTANVSVLDFGNGFAALFDLPNQPVAVTDVFLLAAQGSTITLYQNGASVASATSTSSPDTGEIWIRTAADTFPNPGSAGMTHFQLGAFVPLPTSGSGGLFLLQQNARQM